MSRSPVPSVLSRFDAGGLRLKLVWYGFMLTPVGIAMLQSSVFEAWFAWPGIAVGALLVLGSFEFVGRLEENG